MHQPEQLQLFEFVPQHQIKAIHDPYWDELEAENLDIVEQVLFVEIAPQQNICVGEQVTRNTLKVAPQHDGKLYPSATEEIYTHWVEKYWVERVGNKYWYYRYMWMEGRKIHRAYIGSVRSHKANSKKQAVEDAIIDGQSPEEIKQLIRGLEVNSFQGVFC